MKLSISTSVWQGSIY